MSDTGRAETIRRRLRDDFPYYAKTCLKIATKPDAYGVSGIVPLELNAAQIYIHEQIEAQRERLGLVRAIILKGRQQGASTYTEGRYYWKTSSHSGQKTYILTHKSEATENLFGMAKRYHDNVPPFVRPTVSKMNAGQMVFDRLDSRYQVATAGAKGAGRSATLTNVHGSEVGYWENAASHLSGMLQAVPFAPGTEVILESTANGVGNIFHQQWVMAEKGESDFIAIFVPWFWSREYRRELPDDFALNDDEGSVPDGELTEAGYKAAYKLDDRQIMWRRMKIIELGGGEEGFDTFKQEYPATADEAFQSSNVGNSLIKRKFVVRARKNKVSADAAAGGSGPLVIGVDPGGEGEGGDPTGIIRRRGRRMYSPQLLTKLSTMQIASLIVRLIKTERPAHVMLDVGGLGVGIWDRLSEMEGTRGVVIPVNFGSAANDALKYVNRRAEMHWTLKEWLEDDAVLVSIPDEDRLQADFMASVIAPADSNQRRQLRSKVWMKSKGIRSPNLADAAALTFALPADPTGQGGQVGNSMTDFDPLNAGAYESNVVGDSTFDFDPFG